MRFTTSVAPHRTRQTSTPSSSNASAPTRNSRTRGVGVGRPYQISEGVSERGRGVARDPGEDPLIPASAGNEGAWRLLAVDELDPRGRCRNGLARHLAPGPQGRHAPELPLRLAL